MKLIRSAVWAAVVGSSEANGPWSPKIWDEPKDFSFGLESEQTDLKNEKDAREKEFNQDVRLPESIWDVPLIVGKNKVVNDEHRIKATDSFLQDILKSIELDDKNINGVYFDFLDSWGTPSQRPVNLKIEKEYQQIPSRFQIIA